MTTDKPSFEHDLRDRPSVQSGGTPSTSVASVSNVHALVDARGGGGHAVRDGQKVYRWVVFIACYRARVWGSENERPARIAVAEDAAATLDTRCLWRSASAKASSSAALPGAASSAVSTAT